MSTIPFNDLSRTPPELLSEIEDAVGSVVRSGWFVMGPQHAALEQELAAYLGVSSAVLVGNGTDALELALCAVGVKAGDLVLTTANSGAYTSVASRLLSARPVFADVAADTLLMTAETFERALVSLPKTPAAVVVTHLYGMLANVAEIAALARQHGIAVVEDCAQALGSRRGGRLAGSFGDVATTSFYPTKNLGALGDGGAVLTSRPEVADRVRQLRQYGWSGKYTIERAHGKNSRMDELQAAIVRVKMSHLDRWNERRRAIHTAYEEARPTGLRFVTSVSPAYNGHLAVVQASDAAAREVARDTLRSAGIATDVHYPVPDHLQPLKELHEFDVSLPVTERAAQTIFSLPLFPELSDEEVAHVSAALGSL
ncbi:DegT/DnrJ/EryC1/StrS family aminotransferase [Microbacterium sp. STN6]|uniref:DegT/DnrJ/EryC1/StrS family aminotransferase n=1 Tax=Microbacterium sp. STN6 TaxID=2995588 RepID=UPI002260F778|nr:DegT/DnrJ/EryC1/StrS family aminotransferase [Microbacterium sp. STN6]MCX7521039.1 DegT/DnrJ/EryC1/StrS family aminotransferase [Microbacterium sp. STN6]